MSGLRSWLRLLAAGVVICLVAAPVLATGATRGQISGVVKDRDGAPLPGVTVVATGDSLQGERAAKTNADGEFNLAGLPAGRFVLTFDMEGHQRLELKDVQVMLGKIVPVQATLQQGTYSETVEVNADYPLIEPKTANNTVNMTEEQLDKMPAPGRTFVDMARYVPSVTGTDFNTSDPTGNAAPSPSFRGEGQYGDNYLVDGLSVRDPSIKTSGTPLNYDAIEEVQFVVDGFSPEFSGALGGSINAITKSGSNNFGGDLAYLYQSNSTSAEFQETLLATPNDFERTNPYVNVGGPILQDKLWYFGSYNRFDNSATFSPAELPGFGTLPAGTEETQSDLLFGKLTWAANQNHNLSANYTARNGETSGLDASIATPEARSGQNVDDNRIRLNYQAILSANALLEVRAGSVNREIKTVPQQGLGPAQYEVSTFGLLTNNAWRASGDERSRQDAALVYTQFFNPGGWAGTHEFRVGADAHVLNQDTIDQFSGLDEDVFSTGQNPLQADFGGADTFDDGTKFQTVDNAGILVPTTLNEYRSGGLLNNKNQEWGAFVQDRWETGNWNFLVGFRVDSQKGLNDVGETYFDYGPAEAFAPRASITWDVKGTGKNLIKTGWGRFYDTTSLRLGEFANDREAFAFRNYSWVGGTTQDFRNHIDDGSAFDIHNAANWNFTTEQSNDQNPLDYTGIQHPAHVDRFLFEYNRQINNNYAFKGRYVNGKTRQLIEDIHTNLLEFTVANTDLKRRDYQSFEMEFNGNPSRNISFNLGLVHSQAKGTNPGQFESAGFLGDSGSGNNIGVYLDRPPAEDPAFWCGDFTNPSCAPENAFFGFPGTVDDPTTPEFEPALSDFNNDGVANAADWEQYWQNLWGGLGGLDGDDGWYGDLPYSVDTLFKGNARFTIPQWADTYVTVFAQIGTGYRNQRYGFQPLYGDYLHFSEDGVVEYEYQGACTSFADCQTLETVTPVAGQNFGAEQGLTRGTLESDTFWSVDMSIGKLFNFGSRIGLEVRGEFFNLFNTQPVLGFQNRATSTFGVPLVRQTPRSARLFARLSF